MEERKFKMVTGLRGYLEYLKQVYLSLGLEEEFITSKLIIIEDKIREEMASKGHTNFVATIGDGMESVHTY